MFTWHFQYVQIPGSNLLWIVQQAKCHELVGTCFDIIVFVSPLVQVHAAKIRLYTSFIEAKIHGFQC
jgi:hypothetical protein